MKKNLDMTEGKPISLLWAFTFPTLMGNLLNQVYSITDSIVVGRYLGQTALAAVGPGWSPRMMLSARCLPPGSLIVCRASSVCSCKPAIPRPVPSMKVAMP